MGSKHWEQVKRIVGDAIQAPPGKRTRLINEQCGSDAQLRLDVEQLLLAHDEAGGFLRRDGGASVGGGNGAGNGATSTLQEPGPGLARPGTSIGPYRIVQALGEGGFGVVYMAEQTEPVQRKVALKVIKLGMDTREVLARFDAERRALAMMDHPNIAKVLDAGATAEGRPYFVMELVKGVPITKYCDDYQLTVRERLKLFAPVCQALQHAHQKGIVHRDIKPANVLVTIQGDDLVPKVIDFGIAKAVDRRLTERTLVTEYGQMIGTPSYMSPEQAEMSGLDVDTRSDVYSLGVLL